MADPPSSFERLTRLVDVATLAHGAIFELHRELVELDRADDHTRKLLAETASLAVIEIPRLYKPAGQLHATWLEQDLLGAPDAGATRRLLEHSAALAVAQVEGVRARQNAIAAELRRLIEVS